MPEIPAADLSSFRAHLARSERILVLLWAGLSASSGLPTFRGAGGLWRSYKATALATPEAFDENPGLVWQFYSYRRHMSLQAKPNPAHLALAEMARGNNNFMTISQNVDGKFHCHLFPLGQVFCLANHRDTFLIQVFRNEQSTRSNSYIFSMVLFSTSNAQSLPATTSGRMTLQTRSSLLWLFPNRERRLAGLVRRRPSG